MFRNRPTETLVVNEAGLARVIRDLHHNTGLFEYSRGVTVRAFAQSKGNFVVYLTADQTQTLLSLLPGKTLQNEYEDA